MERHLSLLTKATFNAKQPTQRMEREWRSDKNTMKESLTVSVLTCLMVFLWRLLISAECRLHFYCQHQWKEEREREKENCIAAKKEEFVIGWEWFQMLEQKHVDWESSRLLTHVFAAGAWAAVTDPSTLSNWQEWILVFRLGRRGSIDLISSSAGQ